MIIQEIRLHHFRNYDDLRVFPHDGVNLFFGANGSGKTNLLEAIHYCALGKSHRVTQDQPVVKIGESSGVCQIRISRKDGQQDISVRLTPRETIKKTILIDHQKISRYSELMGCLQCVIFSPEDLDIIKEGPAVRRRFLDMMISQIHRGYFIALQQYRSSMEQRNAILRNIRQGSFQGRDMLTDFEKTMASAAQIIVQERNRLVFMLSGYSEELYSRISEKKDEQFQIGYYSTIRDTERIEETFSIQLKESREEDIRLGLTSIGPHRDDLHLSLNRKQLRQFASQGQIRTAALSLKLGQMKVLMDVSGETPVLLLDDVMSELDRNRRLKLIREIEGFQTFITCTDQSDLEEDLRKRVYLVSSVQGEGRIMEQNAGEQRMKEKTEEPDFSMD